jgi:hypothetical protein
MGHRYFFYRVSLADIAEVRDLSYKELVEYCKNKQRGYERTEWSSGEVEESVSLRELVPQVEVFGFGKYYEHAEEIEKMSAPMFSNKDTMQYFADYSSYVCDVKVLESAIEWQTNKIKSYYEGLMLSDQELVAQREADVLHDDRTALERLQNEIRHKLREWNDKRMLPFSLDKERPMISSWLYEYTIFELVKLHREMDWEKDCLLFYGW